MYTSKKASQKGFSAVEIVIAVLIVGILCFGSWYVWHKNQKTSSLDRASNSTNQTAQTQPNANDKDDTAAPSDEQVDPYAGWKTYTFDGGAFSVRYPSDWTVTDETSNTNSYVSIWLESPSKPYGSVILTFDVIKESFVSQYDVEGNVQTLGNKLRLWTKQMQWSSKGYNNFQPFDCARLRLLDTDKNQEVKLPVNRYLSTEGGFCMNQNSYTTKSYAEQLDSAEIKDAIKIYESVLAGN